MPDYLQHQPSFSFFQQWIYCKFHNQYVICCFSYSFYAFLQDQDIWTVSQAEQDFLSQQQSSNKRTDSEFRDLSSVVERLHRKQIKKDDLKLQDFYEQFNIENGRSGVVGGCAVGGGSGSVNNQNNSTVNNSSRSFNVSSNTSNCSNSDGGCSSNSSEVGSSKSIVIQLSKVPDCKNAVYQTVKTNDNDNMKTEVGEVHDMLENNNAFIGPDGKAMSVSPLDGALVNCEICDEKFTTEKTLKIHIAKKHIASTTVYQCPSSNCSESFLQPAAVFKHLSITHNKTQKRIRQMRDGICKRPKRSDEVIVKPLAGNRELQKLKAVNVINQDEDDMKTWTGEKKVEAPSCPYCNKTFDRKAVLTAHVVNCKLNKMPSVVRKRPQTPKELVIAKQIEAVNKRKRKGPIVIRNEEPDIKDEIDEYWSSSEQADEEMPIQPSSDDVKQLSDLQNKTVDKTIEEDDDKDPDELVVVEESTKIKRKPKKENGLDKSDTVKDIPCALCSKKFANNTNLKRHVAMFHFRQNRFACKLCDYRGYRRIDTISHLGNLHNIQGEKESFNDYIELIVKPEDDQRPPINTDEGYDTNVTFSSVVASIVNNADKSLSITMEAKPVPDQSSSSLERSTKKRKLSQLLEINELPKIKIEVESCKKETTTTEEPKSQTSSRLSSPSSEPDNKRPTRNRVKPVRKDFVYNLNTIIKQEAEMHREQQLQQQAVMPLRSQRRRNTICDVKESRPKLRSSSTDLNKDKAPRKLNFSFSLDEVIGAAHKMAKIEVMNQRACFNRPPEPPERTVIPTKLTPQRPSSELVSITDIKESKKSKRNKNEVKPKEIKRTLSFTDTLLLQTDANRGKLLLEAASKTTVEPIIQFPPTKPPFSLAEFASQLSSTSSPVTSTPISNSSSPNSRRSTKAIKKQELSSKEQSQIEMLQRFRNNQNSIVSQQSMRSRLERRSVPEPEVTLTPIGNSNASKRISVLQRLADNYKKKVQETEFQVNNTT